MKSDASFLRFNQFDFTSASAFHGCCVMSRAVISEKTPCATAGQWESQARSHVAQDAIVSIRKGVREVVLALA